MERYDLIVVGSGPGGYIAAERAGKLGKKVLLIEDDPLQHAACSACSTAAAARAGRSALSRR